MGACMKNGLGKPSQKLSIGGTLARLAKKRRKLKNDGSTKNLEEETMTRQTGYPADREDTPGSQEIDDGIYDDAPHYPPTHPVSRRLREMQFIEEKNKGRYPEALLPRLTAWLSARWAKLRFR